MGIGISNIKIYGNNGRKNSQHHFTEKKMFCAEKRSGSGKDDLISWQHSKYFLFLVLVEFKYYFNAIT